MINRITKILPITAIFIAWFYTYLQGINTAIDIWIISEIFNHCLFVIPGALYLIYQKRIQLSKQPFTPNYWLLLPLIGSLILYTFGYVGDIRLFMHIATFVSLPLLIWMVIGNQAAKIIAFPLYFMLFSIPVGEELIPYLQELTTDLAVPLLEMTGVPIYRNGLYLDIPEGRFLVAEACSGISFLVASIVFGNIYAYISFRTFSKQLLFVFISLIVPIIANALRVYGIILTAHLTDMEYAAGADHLIYGGVFYAIILFLLIGIGERFRDKEISLNSSVPAVTSNSSDISAPWAVVGIVTFIFVIQFVWLKTIKNNKLTVNSAEIISTHQLSYNFHQRKLVKWQPHFPQAAEYQEGAIVGIEKDLIDFFIAAYTSGKGELISSLNKLYDAERWTLLDSGIININNSKQQAQFTLLVSPRGQKRIIIHWYQISDRIFTNEIKAKLYQTASSLLGKVENSGVIAFSLEYIGESRLAVKSLETFIENNQVEINAILLNH